MIDVDAYYEQKIGLLWRTLRGGLWHATPSHRFRTILKTGHILCDPQLVEGEFQWASANGFTTLCRDIGAVSLFDFGEADWPWIFENHHDWLSFLKAPQLAVPEDKWIAIVWIGFDRQSLKNLMDLDSVKDEWKQDSTRKLRELYTKVTKLPLARPRSSADIDRLHKRLGHLLQRPFKPQVFCKFGS